MDSVQAAMSGIPRSSRAGLDRSWQMPALWYLPGEKRVAVQDMGLEVDSW